MKRDKIIYPAPLERGDKIAIVSPATKVKGEYVDGAAVFFERHGFHPVVMPGAKGPADGSFASSLSQRRDDILAALSDPDVKCIFCARGGYGCIHLLPELPEETIRRNPKWLVGFSDISALHALWHTAGVASLHAPMAKHLTLEGDYDPCTRALLDVMTGDPAMHYAFPGDALNREGVAIGELRGGNLAVLNGLAQTPWDMLNVGDDEDVILFVEDISEAVYAVERMLTRLILSGNLGRVKGVIVGQFTEYGPDLNHEDMEEMVSRLLSRHGLNGIPVAYRFPVGHVVGNYPMIEGAQVELRVGKDMVELHTIEY